MAKAGTAEANGKVKKAKRLEYRSGEDESGTSFFNGGGNNHNVKVAIARAEAFRATLSEEQSAALTALLKGFRDNVGWTKGGRILLKGNAERGT